MRKVDHKPTNDLIDKFRQSYKNQIVTDGEIKVLQRLVKDKEDHIDVLKILNEHIIGKFMTFENYVEINALREKKFRTTNDIRLHHGNSVWQLKYRYIIDFWNYDNDGMDDCFNTCTNIHKLHPIDEKEIYSILTSRLSNHSDCCTAKTYLNQNKV